jgi:hypothetical protein
MSRRAAPTEGCTRNGQYRRRRWVPSSAASGRVRVGPNAQRIAPLAPSPTSRHPLRAEEGTRRPWSAHAVLDSNVIARRLPGMRTVKRHCYGCWSTLRVCPTGRPHATHISICPGESATRCGSSLAIRPFSRIAASPKPPNYSTRAGSATKTGRHDAGGSRVDRAWLRAEASPGSGNVGRTPEALLHYALDACRSCGGRRSSSGRRPGG